VIVGDHGLQDGPGAFAWTAQTAHRNPYLAIIAPATAAANAAAVRWNRDRMVTMHDLYATMTTLLRHDASSGGGVGAVAASSPRPPWAVDILREHVPAERSCRDAHVPPDFCVCQHEFTAAADDMAGLECSPHEPHSTGTCNPIGSATKRQGCCQRQLRL